MRRWSFKKHRLETRYVRVCVYYATLITEELGLRCGWSGRKDNDRNFGVVMVPSRGRLLTRCESALERNRALHSKLSAGRRSSCIARQAR